jgi:hypothetical protein
MGMPGFQRRRACCALAVAAACAGLAACAVQAPTQPSSSPMTLQPFATDGCSRFPDRSPIGKADWCHCCVAHDLAYWRGGTAGQRLQADQALKACVQQASGNEALAALMFNGVRIGGGPEFDTPYRWGYGWPFGRGYAPLTPQEDAQASELERDYLAAQSKSAPCGN